MLYLLRTRFNIQPEVHIPEEKPLKIEEGRSISNPSIWLVSNHIDLKNHSS